MARKEDGSIYFDEQEQAKVDEIVKERLARVKAEKPEDYDDLKEIEKDLEDFGFSGTPAEKKAAIKIQKEQIRQQKELEELQSQAAKTGSNPELLKEISDLKKEIAESKKVIEEITGERQAVKQAAEQKKTQQENWNKQIAEFNEKHSDIDLSVLEKDEDFIEYAQGRAGTLTSIYEGYEKYTSRLREKTAEEIRAKYKSKELLSTGTGKGSKSETTEYGLTERQKSLAKSNGMSYKEYSELLKNAE